MGLTPVVGGLRRLKNNSMQVAKISLNIPPGDELEVSESVAAQLHAASTHFEHPDGVPVPGRQVEKDADGVPIGLITPDQARADEAASAPKAKKAPAKRAPAKKVPVAETE